MKEQLATMSLYCPKEVKTSFEEIARIEKRSISAMLTIVVSEYIESYQKRRAAKN